MVTLLIYIVSQHTEVIMSQISHGNSHFHFNMATGSGSEAFTQAQTMHVEYLAVGSRINCSS